MTWSAWLVETMTGRKGEELELADSPSWTIPLNGIEDLTVRVPRSQLREIDRHWWKPRTGSVLLCWESETAGRVPWMLCPIAAPADEDRETDSATLTCKGIGHLLGKRLVLAREYVLEEKTDEEMASQMVWLARSTVELKGMSLGTIAQRIVYFATSAKTGGTLPIRFASPTETHSSYNQRTYYGYNLANIDAWKLLTALTEVINGPDIAFRPEFVTDDEAYVGWAMFHGTRAQPAIPQDWRMDLDTTAPGGPVADVSLKMNDDAATSRVYWTGAGEDAGTLIRTAQDLDRLQDYTPLVETVGSTSDSDNPDLLLRYAEAALAEGAAPLAQLSVSIDGSDLSAEIGRWRVGDLVDLTLAGWLQVEDGRRPRRIISAKGSGSTEVTLEFQEDTW